MIDNLVSVPQARYEAMQQELRVYKAIYREQDEWKRHVLGLRADLLNGGKWSSFCRFFTADDMRLAVVEAIDRILEERTKGGEDHAETMPSVWGGNGAREQMPTMRAIAEGE